MQYEAIRSGNVAVCFFVGLHKNKEVNFHQWKEAQAYGEIQLMPFVEYYSLLTLKTVAICILGVRDAKKMCLVTHKSSFTFEHCWNELRYQPKWMEDVEINQQKTHKPATPGLSSSAPTTVNLEATNETCDLEPVELDRPIGNKAGKEQEKKENKRKKSYGGNDGTSATVMILDSIRVERRQMNDTKKEMMEKIYPQEQEKIQQNAEKIQMKKMEDDERIMSLDTSRMPPLQAEYIQRGQMEILGKQF